MKVTFLYLLLLVLGINTLYAQCTTSAIIGSASVPENSAMSAYYVMPTQANQGSTYSWTITGGAIAANYGFYIQVNWGSAGSGNVEVVETFSGGCVAAPVNLAITIVPVIPCTSSNLLGASSVEESSQAGYFVDLHVGSTYSWTVTGGTIFYENANVIYVNWGGAGSGSVEVVETFSAGCTGAPLSLPITINSATTSPIFGPTNVNENETHYYQVVPHGGSTYAWIVVGGAITYDYANGTIAVQWGSAGSGSVEVVETFSGGNVGAPVNLPVTINGISCPTTSIITGETVVCENSTSIYYSVTYNLNSQYFWTISGGTFASSSGGYGVNGVYVNWGSTGTGSLHVDETFYGGCPAGTSNLAVSIVSPNPGPISGSTEVCVNTLAEPYSIPNTSGSSYSWSIVGGTQASGGNSNSITVDWGSSGGGSVSVTETTSSGCISSPVTLVTNIALAATITTHPSIVPQTFCPFYGNATLSISASNATGIQWYTNGVNSNIGGVPITGATNNTYVVPSASTAGIQYYYAIVQGLCGQVISNVSGAVTVIESTTIITDLSPTTQIVCQNSALAPLFVTTSGAGPITYQWYTSSGGTWTAIPGATSANYTPSTALVGSTQYYVEATGACTAFPAGGQSSIVNVTVDYATTIDAQPDPVDRAVSQNSSAGYLSIGVNATPPISFQWYSNANNNNIGGTLITGATSNTYTPPTSSVGITYYYAVASGGCGTATSSVSGSITVIGSQTIMFGPLSPIIAGGTLSLAATASSGLPITFSSSDPSVASTSGDILTAVGPGNATITASQSGSTIYYPASPVGQSITVTPLVSNQTLIFDPLPSKTYGDTDFLLTAYSSSGLPISYSTSDPLVAHFDPVNNNMVIIVGAGTVEITATQPGNSQYNPATPVAQTLVVGKASQIITFNALPQSPFCPNTLIPLNASSSVGLPITFSSSDVSVATASDFILTPIDYGTATISAVQVGNNNYLPGSESQVISVNPIPYNITIFSNDPIPYPCPGITPTLTALGGDGNASYSWAPSGLTTQSISVFSSGTYTVTVTDAVTQCKVTVSQLIEYRPETPVTVSPSNPKACPGGGIQLTANVGLFYEWIDKFGESISFSQSVIAYTVASPYRVKVVDANGCENWSSAISVGVEELPVATITADGSTTFCSGGSVNLTAGTAFSYLWSTGETTQTISASSSGNYTVTVTNAAGCNVTSSPTPVSVNPLPTASIAPGSPATICSGESVTPISVTATGGIGSFSYQWHSNSSLVFVNGYPANGLTISGATSAIYHPSVLGSNYYYAVVTDGCGSMRTSNYSGLVTIDPPPTITTNPSPVALTICKNSSSTSLSVAASGAGVISYQWYSNTVSSNSGGSAISNATGPNFSPPTNVVGTKYYYATATGTCGSATSSVSGPISVVQTKFTTQPSTSLPTTCLNGTTPALSVAATGVGPVTYKWFKNTNSSTSGAVLISGANSSTYTPLTSSIGTLYYRAKATSSCGTVWSNPVQINVIQCSVAITGMTKFCEGSHAELYADTGGQLSNFLWSTGENTAFINVTSPGTYSVTATTIFGGAILGPAYITVTMVQNTGGASITKSESCLNTSMTLTANPAGPNYYLWSTGVTGQAINISSSGNYTVGILTQTGTQLVGCIDIFPCAYVRVRTPKAEPLVIEEVGPDPIEITQSVYPSPADNELNVVLRSNSQSDVSIHLTDYMGKLIKSGTILSGEKSTRILTDDVAGGIYLLQIEVSKDVIVHKKVMVVHRN